MTSRVPKKPTSLARRLMMAAGVALVMLPSAGFAFTAQQVQALQLVSRKFTAYTTMSGDFVQYGPDGSKTQGRFYISRPGRIRFDYAAPSTLDVVSDGKSVLVHDRRLVTYDLWPLSQTPLKFLLDSQLDLSSSSKVTGVEIEPDLIQVVISDDRRFGGGKLSLVFDKQTDELRHWTVTDQQGLDTSVDLFNIKYGMPIPDQTFKISYTSVTNAARERK
ncbi:Outer membrane lipoprotein-sorting protein [Faunimonas pinastri]|uniref:Outer membrane lipoprotein-sorting protein n=1 Tax=Faunimonas pinastri TaxID=1855383 RepID=A0A1H9GUU0_9HYPH|nr:outer membrane lipoprotein carrier protein LolA [Faunimonas pinastri]SEQ53763.1 Outer membrane lipoprotein-sorting protein [Faunimonas pinastri]